MRNSAGECDIYYTIASRVGVGLRNLNCANFMLKDSSKLLVKCLLCILLA
jgi:hypothetical protein